MSVAADVGPMDAPARPVAAPRATPSGQPSVAWKSASTSSAPCRPPPERSSIAAHSSGVNARSAGPSSSRRPAARSLATRSSSGAREATATETGPASIAIRSSSRADRLLGAREPLGVVDHDRHRVEQQRPELGRQLAEDLVRVDRPPRPGHALGEDVDRARHHRAQAVHDPDEQVAAVRVRLGARHPHRLASLQRALERGRLAEPGARDEQHGAGVEPFAQALDQVAALDPGSRGNRHVGASISARGCACQSNALTASPWR